MSGTPETDAAVMAAGGDWSYPLRECSRRLERERDEAREKYATEATEHMLAVNKLANERDEARQSTLRLDVVNFKLRKERNEAVDEVRRLKVILDLLKKEAR
jgi:hypothetical protein